MNLYLNKQNFLSYNALKIHEIKPLTFVLKYTKFSKKQ